MWFCKKELTLINLLKLDIFLKYKGNFRKSEEFPAIGRRLLRFLHRNDSDGEYIRCPRCLPPASSPPRRPLIDAPPGLSISFLPFWLFYPSSWELHNLILCALTTMQRSGMPGKVRFRAELSPQEEPEPPPKPSALGVPTSTLRAGLGALGFLETAYLTYVKFTGAEAFCPVGGGSCGGVLNSDYSFIFGRLFLLINSVAFFGCSLNISTCSVWSKAKTRWNWRTGLCTKDYACAILFWSAATTFFTCDMQPHLCL